MRYAISITYVVPVPSERVSRFRLAPHVGPRIVIISGGSGAGTLSQVIKKYTHNSIHLVAMYDDGGSSKIIREAFDIPPPGDLRNRLMHLADETDQGHSEIIDVFTHRLPSTEYTAGDLQDELTSFVKGSHTKILAVDRGLANIISLYLSHFDSLKPHGFDLRRASIGNMVMTGCYFLHGSNYENAVYLISSLAEVRGTVIPITLGNYHLGAELMDGTKILGQANITKQQGRYSSSIHRVFFVEKKREGAQQVKVPANSRAVDALKNADVILFSTGSFFTSIIPCIMTESIAAAIRLSKAPKVMVANSVVDDETRGYTLSRMLSTLVAVCQGCDPEPGMVTDYIQYVVANNHGLSEEYRGVGTYIPVDRKAIEELGLVLLEYPLEVSRGKFDPALVAEIVLSFAHL